MSAFIRITAALSFAVFAWGCDSGGGGVIPATFGPAATAADVLQFDGYTIEYLPSTDGTTFTYRVSGSGDAANLNYVFVETACSDAPASLSPSNAVSPTTSTEADTTLAGVRWNQGLGEGGSRDYAIAYDAPQEEGAVTIVIRSGNAVQTGLIAGACGNLFDLGGSVFVNDGDDDGSVREATELGIQNVRVDIYDDAGEVAASVMTEADGRYSARLLRGDYEVSIPEAAGAAFNATLSGAYDPAGETRRAVTLDADVSDADFGYNPDKEVILAQLSDGGDFVTNGEEVRVWKRWIDKASRGRSFSDDGVTTAPVQVAEWLDLIFASADEPGDEFFGNASPYELAPGSDPFEAAAAILGTKLNRRSTDAEILYVELFAMQLNYFSGRGSQNPLYDETLIEYFEETVGLDLGSASSRMASGSDGALMASAVVAGGLDTEIARAFNGGGGGGQVGD